MDGTLFNCYHANLCAYGTGRREKSNGGDELISKYMLQSSILPSPTFNEAREKRRKVLDEVRARRRIIYQRYRKKVLNHSSLEFAV